MLTRVLVIESKARESEKVRVRRAAHIFDTDTVVWATVSLERTTDPIGVLRERYDLRHGDVIFDPSERLSRELVNDYNKRLDSSLPTIIQRV